MKPKEWLHKNGHIEVIGRGRLSGAHIALIQEAVANGVQIEGYSVVSGNQNTETTTAPTVQRTAVDPNRIVDVPDAVRDEREVEAFYREDGKVVKIGMRTVDNVCGNSLTYCHCESPRVWVDSDRQVVVNFRNTTN
jgi:hypothetical protein